MSALSEPLVLLLMFICWLQKTVLAELRLLEPQLPLRQQMPHWTPRITIISAPMQRRTGAQQASVVGMFIARLLEELPVRSGKSALSGRLHSLISHPISALTTRVLQGMDRLHPP